MPEANRSMQNYIFNWLNCRNSVESLERQLTRAKKDLAGAAAKLGEAMAPKDLEPGEKVGLWGKVSESTELEALFVVEKDRHTDLYNITMRSERPRKDAK